MQHSVVRLGRPTRPHDLRSIAPQPGRKLLPRLRQRGLRPRPQPVRAGGIPHIALHRIQPRRARGMGERVRGVMIEVEH